MDVEKAVEPTAAKAPVAAVGCEQYRAEISKYDWDVNVMMAIMQAESGCISDRVGDNYPIAGLLAPSCGLFQIRTLAGRPNCEQLKNPSTNVEWAHKIFTGQGLRAWSVYSSGKYLKFM